MKFIEGVSNWELYSRTDTYQKFVRNPSKVEKETGYYFPRLTGYKRRFGDDANVRIEFSIPKLLFLNNLDEVDDSDFDLAITTLQERLIQMGVVIGKSVLKTANVSSVHYSKNIPISDGYTVSYIISELNKIDIRKSFDFAKTRFLNDGQSLYAHTTAHQFVIYDKMADLQKRPKRAIDKTPTLFQRSLFSSLENKLEEVLRFEIRLNKKQKLKQILAENGRHQDPTFSDIFNKNLSKEIVNSYWNKLIKDRNLAVFSLELKPKDLLLKILKSETKPKPNRAIYLAGLYSLTKDGNGTRQLRSILEKSTHQRTWYRITKDIKEIGEIISEDYLRDWVKQVEKELQNYKTFKIKNYENKTNN